MPRRKRNSWGSVAVVTKGKKYRIRYWGKGADGEYKRRCETFCGSWKQACDRLATLRLEHSGEHAVPTVGQAYELWWVPWADRRCETGEMKPQSRRVFDSVWRNHVKPRWKDVPLDAVDPSDLEKWFLSTKPSAAAKSRVLLRRIFDRARFAGATRHDPFATSIDMPVDNEPRTPKRMKTFTADEALQLLSSTKGSPIEGAIIVACFGSARVGESLAVRAVECVYGEAENGIPVCAFPIMKQVMNRGGSVRSELKTTDSPRYGVVVGPIASRLHEVAVERVESGLVWLSDDGTGEPIKQATLNRILAREIGKAGLPPAEPRSLRRTWETTARWTLKLSFEDREVMMGHKLPGVSDRHYDKPLPRDFVRVASEAYALHPFASRWVN